MRARNANTRTAYLHDPCLDRTVGCRHGRQVSHILGHLTPFYGKNPGRPQGLRHSVVRIDRKSIQKVVRSAVRRLKALNSKMGTFAICASIKNS